MNSYRTVSSWRFRISGIRIIWTILYLLTHFISWLLLTNLFSNVLVFYTILLNITVLEIWQWCPNAKLKMSIKSVNSFYFSFFFYCGYSHGKSQIFQILEIKTVYVRMSNIERLWRKGEQFYSVIYLWCAIDAFFAACWYFHRKFHFVAFILQVHSENKLYPWMKFHSSIAKNILSGWSVTEPYIYIVWGCETYRNNVTDQNSDAVALEFFFIIIIKALTGPIFGRLENFWEKF